MPNAFAAQQLLCLGPKRGRRTCGLSSQFGWLWVDSFSSEEQQPCTVCTGPARYEKSAPQSTAASGFIYFASYQQWRAVGGERAPMATYGM